MAAVGRTPVGYYSLATAQVEHAGAPERVRKGLARHPVPVILLARLAVDRTWQGRGLGSALLRDLAAADIIGVRAVLVHAKDEAAQRFYAHFGFDASPVDTLTMLLLVKDIAAQLRR